MAFDTLPPKGGTPTYKKGATEAAPFVSEI